MKALDAGWLNGQIVEHAPDAIIVADRDGIIRMWNAGAQDVLGYTAEEALGQRLDLIIPEQFRARHWDGYRKVMETGVTRYGAELLEVPAIRKDGTRISVEFSITLLRTQSEEVLGVAAIMRDVTQRWTQQKQMRQRLADLEAQVAAAPDQRSSDRSGTSPQLPGGPRACSSGSASSLATVPPYVVYHHCAEGESDGCYR